MLKFQIKRVSANLSQNGALKILAFKYLKYQVIYFYGAVHKNTGNWTMTGIQTKLKNGNLIYWRDMELE